MNREELIYMNPYGKSLEKYISKTHMESRDIIIKKMTKIKMK